MERRSENADLENGKQEKSVERVSSKKSPMPSWFKREPSSRAKQQHQSPDRSSSSRLQSEKEESVMKEGTQESEKKMRAGKKNTLQGADSHEMMIPLRGVVSLFKGDANQRQAAEASSSTWMQMVQEVTDLESALQLLEKVEEMGSPMAELQQVPVAELQQEPDHEPVGTRPPHVAELPRPPAPAGSTSWVEEMTRIIDGTTLNRGEEKGMWTKPRIYRVPEWVKSNNRRAYRPEVVSLGPFHHGAPNLLPMEEHKRRLMLHMVKRSGKPFQHFFNAVKEVAVKLQNAYDGIHKKWLGNNTHRFVEMMVTDGGFLLEIMTITPKEILRDYDADHDPIFSMHGILHLKRRIRSDMCLVENQLPLLVLKKLQAVRTGAPPPSQQPSERRSKRLEEQNLKKEEEKIDKQIKDWVTGFLCHKPVQKIDKQINWFHRIFYCIWSDDNNSKEDKQKEKEKNEEVSIENMCPLDVFHKSFCGMWPDDSSSKENNEEVSRIENTMHSAVELREAGINFKISKTQSIQDIDFRKGVLRMPMVEVDDTTEKIFLNLMAFEKLHTNAGTHATDYMIFMDNIIDSEKDLALLRQKGVIRNFLSSDKAAVTLFNTLRKGARLNPKSKLGQVQWKVADHCKRTWHKCWAIFRHTYMSNPWVFISLVAAGILLVITILQTAYTIVPFYTKG